MTETVIAGTELTLTARIDEDGVLTIVWDRLPTTFIFHEGYAALLRPGRGDAEGMVEMVRAPINVDREVSGYVEPLLHTE